MERFDIGLKWVELAKGVVELIVDESKLAFHALTDQFRHQSLSEHFTDAVDAEPPTLPYDRFDLEGGRWNSEGNYYEA